MPPDPEQPISVEELETRYRRHMVAQRVWRLGQRLFRRRVPVLPGLLYYFVRYFFNAEVGLTMEMPRGVVLMHNGLGTIIHPGVELRGPAVIFHHVTLGNSWGANEGLPVIGRWVFVGAGAAVLGDIEVGDFAVIGTNAVVTRDVPSYHLATGNPASVRPVEPQYVYELFRATHQ